MRLIHSTICDEYPYRHRKVGREEPAATFDVYLAAPDNQIDCSAPGASAIVERDCNYVGSLAQIIPTCCFCWKPIEYHPWQYGHDAEPVAKKGKRCCDRCYVTRVLPARLKADLLAGGDRRPLRARACLPQRRKPVKPRGVPTRQGAAAWAVPPGKYAPMPSGIAPHGERSVAE